MYCLDFSSVEEWKKSCDKYPALINSGSRYIKDSQEEPLQQVDHRAYVEKWAQKMTSLGEIMTNYEKQEICAIITKHHEKVDHKCGTQKQKITELIENSAAIKEKASRLKEEL